MKVSKDFMRPFNGRVTEGRDVLTPEQKKKRADKNPILPEVQKVYYVYQCFVDGELKYIGMGKGNRYQHCKSGKSSCIQLNKDFHDGKDIEVVFYEKGLTQAEASAVETDLIWDYKDSGIYNKQMYPNMASQPLISKIVGVKVKEKQDPLEIYKQIVKVSPNVDEFNFENLLHWMKRCDLHFQIAEIGTTKTLVVDKAHSKAFDYLHTGCPNWPNCSTVGCGR